MNEMIVLDYLKELIPHSAVIFVGAIFIFSLRQIQNGVLSKRDFLEVILIIYIVDIVLVPFLLSDWPTTNAFFTEWPTIVAFFTEWPTMNAFLNEWPTINAISQDKHTYGKLMITVFIMLVIRWKFFRNQKNNQNSESDEEEKKGGVQA